MDHTKMIAVTTTLSHELGSLCSVPGFATICVDPGQVTNPGRPQFSYSYDERVSERQYVM